MFRTTFPERYVSADSTPKDTLRGEIEYDPDAVSHTPDTEAISNPWGNVVERVRPSTLRIHLLPDRHGGWTLFSEKTHQVWRRHREATARAKEARADREATLQERLQGALHWMRQRGSSSEKALRELREPEAVEVIHPTALSEAEAHQVWRDLLAGLVRQHRRWLIVHGSLLPLGALATVVPGPNIWFVYLAWRTLAHWRTAQGGSRALDEVPVRFTPEPGLDDLVELMERRMVLRRKEKIRALGERLGIEELDAAY